MTRLHCALAILASPLVMSCGGADDPKTEVLSQRALPGDPPRTMAMLVLSGAGIAVAEAQSRIETLDEYYRENSNDRVGFQGEAFGVYDVPPSAYTNADNVANQALAAWEAEGHSRDDYDHLAFVVAQHEPFTDEKGRDIWSGNATIGGKRSWFRGTEPLSFVHEIGHNLGLLHAGSLRCDGAAYRAQGDGCSKDPYGHKFDPMGNHGLAGHLSAAQKERLGWLAGCQDVKVGGGGVFQLAPLEGECGIRALKIPIPDQPEYYYVEYRENGSGKWGGVTREQDGVAISVAVDALSKAPNPLQLDFSPPDDFRDGWLTVGTSYSLPGGVQMEVREQNDSRAIVAVQTSGDGVPRCADDTVAPIDSDGEYHGNIGQGCDISSDYCPDDDSKTSPGVCGCGAPDSDANADGVVDCIDPRCAKGEEPDADGDGAYSCAVDLDEAGLSTSDGALLRFTFVVPAGTREVTFTLTPGNLDADLYVRRDAAPTEDAYDCRSGKVGPAEEVCVLNGAGTYHIMVLPYYGQFTDARLKASYKDFTVDECPDDPAKITGCKAAGSGGSGGTGDAIETGTGAAPSALGGNSSGAAGTAAAENAESGSDEGCGCRTARSSGGSSPIAALLALFGVALAMMRRRSS